MGTVLLIQYSVYRTVILRKWYSVRSRSFKTGVPRIMAMQHFLSLEQSESLRHLYGVMGAMLRVRTWNQQLKTKRVVTGA